MKILINHTVLRAVAAFSIVCGCHLTTWQPTAKAMSWACLSTFGSDLTHCDGVHQPAHECVKLSYEILTECW